MKERTVTISRNDILFDVDAETHIFAKVNDGKDPRRFDALESDSEDAFNLNVIIRHAQRRAAELKQSLSRFLKTPTSAVTFASATIDTNAGYSFAFNVEDGFQDELMDPLAKEIEAYIANGTIADWYAGAGDAMAASYQQTLAPTKDRIVSYLVKRKFPTRT